MILLLKTCVQTLPLTILIITIRLSFTYLVERSFERERELYLVSTNKYCYWLTPIDKLNNLRRMKESSSSSLISFIVSVNVNYVLVSLSSRLPSRLRTHGPFIASRSYTPTDRRTTAPDRGRTPLCFSVIFCWEQGRTARQVLEAFGGKRQGGSNEQWCR